MIGTILTGKYELTGLILDGPVFASYSAKDVTAGRDVCIRMIKPPFDRHPGFLEALHDAAAKYGIVKSQHIESIIEVSEDGGHGFMVSELTRGPSLADRVRKLAPFSIPVSVGTAISVCQALEPLHRHNLAHGDLTPQNIAVLANGDVKLQVAGVWEAYSTSPTAGAMVLPGMAPYLAPEVSAGSMPSPSSDVYALGITLFELLTGRMPYYGETSVAIAMQHATAPTPNVRSVNPSVPAVLDEIVKKAMAKNPLDRYYDAGELLADLRLLQDALRFGRTLSWPLRGAATAAPQATVKTKAEKTKGDKSPKQQPVAPRMSAIRTDEEYEKETRRARRDRDVPVWITMIIVFLVAIVLGLIGAWLLMNMNRPKLIPVPNLVGLTKQEAREVLKANKLDMKIEANLPNEKVEMDHITEVNPKAGEKVREGSRVSVVVSSGSRLVAVPDLRGVTVDKARTILGNLGLDLDPEMMKANDESVPGGLVVRSVPAAKSKTERASRVKLVVSIGPGETSARDLPVPAGGYLYTIRLGLDDLTEPTTIKIEIEDEEGTREIYQEEKNTGERVEVSTISKGKEATFHIYYDDRLVKSVKKKADGESEIE